MPIDEVRYCLQRISASAPFDYTRHGLRRESVTARGLIKVINTGVSPSASASCPPWGLLKGRGASRSTLEDHQSLFESKKRP